MFFNFFFIGLKQILLLGALTMNGPSKPTLVPQLPSSVKLGTTSTFNIWNHALRQQKDKAGNPVLRELIDIQTLISPSEMLMVNLVPMDAPHPLYSDEYADLRTEFLLDYMIKESVNSDDEKMTQDGGLIVRNLNGKILTFKRDSEGQLTINGVAVESTRSTDDGITIFTLSGFLFDHLTRIRAAFKDLESKAGPSFGDFMGGKIRGFKARGKKK